MAAVMLLLLIIFSITCTSTEDDSRPWMDANVNVQVLTSDCRHRPAVPTVSIDLCNSIPTENIQFRTRINTFAMEKTDLNVGLHQV